MRRFVILLATGLAAVGGCGDDDDKKQPAAPVADAGTLDGSRPPVDASAARDAAELPRADAALGATAVENVGEACDERNDCNGAAAACVRQVPALGAAFEGGYCTASCTSNSECGPGGGCPVGEALKSPLVAAAAANNPALSSISGSCLLRCEPATSGCRVGYRCSSLVALLPQLMAFPAALRPPSLNEPYCLPDIALPSGDGGLLRADGGSVGPLAPEAGSSAAAGDGGVLDAAAPGDASPDAGSSSDASAVDGGS